MDRLVEQYGRPLLFALGALIGLLFLRLFAARILAVLLPFAFAWLSARLTHRPARFLSRKTRIPAPVLSVSLTLLFFFSIGFGVFFLLRQVIVECGEILSAALSDPALPSKIAGALESASSFILSRLPGGAGGPLLSEEDLAGMVRDGFASLFSSFSRFVGGVLSRIPSFLFAVLVSLVAAVWFSADPDGLSRVGGRLLSPAWQRRAERIGRGLSRYAGTVFYAYGILFCLTFLVLLLGLSVLGVPYALLLSLLISLFDLLPIVGAGGILVPWGIVSIVSGRGAFGACVLFLSFSIFAVRQILTPKLVGRGLGIHPLLVFFSVYAGLRLAGVPGMIAGLFLSVLLSRAGGKGGAPKTE